MPIVRRFGKPDLGSVAVYIISPKQTVLVMDPSKRRADRAALWKLAGGGIESKDGIRLSPEEARIVIETNRETLPKGVSTERLLQVIDAGKTEALEETGVEPALDKIIFLEEERRELREDGGVTYYPNFCIAMVSEEKINRYRPINDEDGKPIMAALFNRAEVPEMADLLERHRPFIKKIEVAMK